MKKTVLVIMMMVLTVVSVFALPSLGEYKTTGVVYMDGRAQLITDDLNFTVYLINDKNKGIYKFIISSPQSNSWVRAMDMNVDGRDEWGTLWADNYNPFYEMENGTYAYVETLLDGRKVLYEMTIVKAYVE
jgi:hypothetical protein